MLASDQDTIVAQATAPGKGGVGITKSTVFESGNLRVDNAKGAVIQGGNGLYASAIHLPTDKVERINNKIVETKEVIAEMPFEEGSR